MNSRSSLNKNNIYALNPGPAFLFLLFGPSFVSAGELVTSRVNVEDGHYLIQVVMDVDAEYQKVYQRLTNYEDLERLSTSITAAEIVFATPPLYQVRVTTFTCISFICEEVVQLQNTTELNHGYIKVSVVPEESDLDYGETLWHIQPYKKGTRITYSSDIVPGFWVPPLIGPVLLKNKLLEETHALINGIEHLAREPD